MKKRIIMVVILGAFLSIVIYFFTRNDEVTLVSLGDGLSLGMTPYGIEGISFNDYLMSDYNEIYSLESANDPEVMIYCTDYMSTYVFNAAECCGESEVDIFLRYAYMSTSAFNIISNSGILKMPKEVQLMMSLLDGKYIPLLIALGYTDIGSWANTELIDVVKESLPDQYNHLMIFDVLDEVMVLVKLYITDDISF